MTSPPPPRTLSCGWPAAAMFGAFGLAAPHVRGSALPPRAALTLPGGMLARALYLYAVAALIGFAGVALVAMLRVERVLEAVGVWIGALAEQDDLARGQGLSKVFKVLVATRLDDDAVQ